MSDSSKHCDDYIEDETQPDCLRKFLDYTRAPAIEQTGHKPKLFADYQGKRVRVVMASRFGDVGISKSLNREYGYNDRVGLGSLTNFSKYRKTKTLKNFIGRKRLC